MSKEPGGWQRFWFEPTSTSTVALVRIAFALVALWWTITLAPDLFVFFSQDGIQNRQPPGWGWGLLAAFPNDVVVVTLFVILLLGILCLLVGFKSRIASIVVFVGMVSFSRRMPWILNSGDVLLRILAFYLMFAPTGAALSVDRWLTEKGRFWESPARAPWALRLIQIQMSVMYLSGVWAKMQGVPWNDGTAVYYALSIEQLERFPVPSFLLQSELVVNLLTYGTLLLEAAIGILVWNRKARPYVLVLGVFLHLGIDYALMVVLFSYAVFVCYLAFVPADWLDAQLLRLRERLEKSSNSRLRRLSLTNSP